MATGPTSPSATLPERARRSLTHERVVAALRSGEALPGRPSDVELCETHTSYVFLAGRRAYKLKKAVVLPFLDFGTAERRQRMCAEELRLNRRLAPAIYRSVRGVVPDGGGFRLSAADDRTAVEHVVEMVRFPAGSTLAAVIERDRLEAADVDRVGGRIARFHAQLSPVEPHGAPLTALRATADETFRTLRELTPRADQAYVHGGDRFTRAFLAGAGGRAIERRAHAGFVREGHGDLRAEHVLLTDPVQVIDCLEFDPALRTIDVGADLSFLLMDLEWRGRPDVAGALLRSYVAHGGDPGAEALVAFHASQRAWVRAKVALIQQRPSTATGLLKFARRLAWRTRGPFPLVICGLSGAGKTTLAQTLAEASGLKVIAADRVRKRLAGIDPLEPAGPGHYSGDFNRRTYRELGRLARQELEEGRAAIVDATFRSTADRQSFIETLGDAVTPLFVECVAALDTRLARSSARGRGVSDATPAIVREQRFDWLAEARPERHVVVRTERPPPAIAGDVEAWLDSTLAAPDVH